MNAASALRSIVAVTGAGLGRVRLEPQRELLSDCRREAAMCPTRPPDANAVGLRLVQGAPLRQDEGRLDEQHDRECHGEERQPRQLRPRATAAHEVSIPRRGGRGVVLIA